MKNIGKITLSIFFFIFILFITNKVEATSITASPSTPKVGQAVTITVTVPNVNTVDLTATVSGAGTSGTVRLVDGSMTGEAKTFSKSITVTPSSTGTINVSISSNSNAVLNGSYVNNLVTSKSITVAAATSNANSNNNTTTQKPTTTTTKPSTNTSNTTQKPSTNNTPEPEKPKSSDSTLSGLSVENRTITPEFNKDVKEYSLSVPYEVTEINVTGTATDSKAKVSIDGNKELKEGENEVKITVKAEDGSTSEYVIKVKRARVPLSLKSLVMKYENQEGEVIEIPLNPEFNSNITEYTLGELEYWVDKLLIYATPNLEGATIDIQGADGLKTGENNITVTIKIAAEKIDTSEEGEQAQEETISYKIKVNKKAEPSTLDNISTWYNENEKTFILGSLAICISILFILAVYIVIDHYKYVDIIKSIKKAKKENDIDIEDILAELTRKEINSNEQIVKEDSEQVLDKDEIEEEEQKPKAKSGKRFK